MLSAALAITSAATGALGAYNAGRFFLSKANEKRKALKEARQARADVREAVKYGKAAVAAVKKALSDGLDDEEIAYAKAIANQVKAALAEEKPVKKGPPSA